ncbi:MAG: alpha/beta hydrolase [Acidimicrobiales bacterium]
MASVSKSLVDATKRMLMDTPLPVVLETNRTLTRADLRPDLATVAALGLPTTIVQGSADASAPIEATGRVTASMLPDARLVEIDGGGHGLYIGHGREYTDLLVGAATAR